MIYILGQPNTPSYQLPLKQKNIWTQNVQY